jgi:hypothetical protein
MRTRLGGGLGGGDGGGVGGGLGGGGRGGGGEGGGPGGGRGGGLQQQQQQQAGSARICWEGIHGSHGDSRAAVRTVAAERGAVMAAG